MPLFVHPLPFRDPLVVFQIFSSDPVATLLDSASQEGERSRYAYIGAEPYCVIRAGNQVMVDGIPVPGDPFTILEQELAAHHLANTGPAPFCTGAMGFFGYGLGRHLEKLPLQTADRLEIPDMVIGLYDVIVAFDMKERKAWVVSSGIPEKSDDARRRRGEERGRAILARIEAGSLNLPALDWSRGGVWQAEQARSEVEASIGKVIDYIHAGDIFQANLTQRFLALRPEGLDDFMLYRRLRALSPSPFAAFLRCGCSLSVASASRASAATRRRRACGNASDQGNTSARY